MKSVCAACHDDQIKGKSAVKTGIPFIGLPRMDDRTLTGTNSIGDWPEDADQPLTPFMRFLLASDPQLRAAMDKLQGVDLSSLPKKDPEKIKAAQTLAWGIKSLIFDLGAHGQEELLKRISLSAGRPLSAYEKEGVVAFFNADSLRTTFQSAFPKLQKEVLDYRNSGKVAPTQLVPSPDLPSPGPVKLATPDAWVKPGWVVQHRWVVHTLLSSARPPGPFSQFVDGPDRGCGTHGRSSRRAGFIQATVRANRRRTLLQVPQC